VIFVFHGRVSSFTNLSSKIVVSRCPESRAFYQKEVVENGGR